MCVHVYELLLIIACDFQVIDLDEVGSSHVLVKGGAGGSHITTNYQGCKGAKGVFTFELKLIAEVGMVG